MFTNALERGGSHIRGPSERKPTLNSVNKSSAGQHISYGFLASENARLCNISLLHLQAERERDRESERASECECFKIDSTPSYIHTRSSRTAASRANLALLAIWPRCGKRQLRCKRVLRNRRTRASVFDRIDIRGIYLSIYLVPL